MNAPTIYRYCPHACIDAAVRLGWHVVGLCPGHHAAYSFLVVWLCDCRAPMWLSGDCA